MAQSNAQRADEGDDQQSERSGRRPVDTARVGNVEIAIWRNQGRSGEPDNPLQGRRRVENRQ
jgi:hypothetical protein